MFIITRIPYSQLLLANSPKVQILGNNREYSNALGKKERHIILHVCLHLLCGAIYCIHVQN